MKLILTIFGLIVCLSGFSQTQLELNEQAYEAYDKAEKELNRVYQKILEQKKEDRILIKNLKASQRLWISFRDAELKLKYPEREPYYYGSMHPMCISLYLEKLTKERISRLEEIISGGIERDVCN